MPQKEHIDARAQQLYEHSRDSHPDRPEWSALAGNEQQAWRDSAEEWLRRPGNQQLKDESDEDYDLRIRNLPPKAKEVDHEAESIRLRAELEALKKKSGG